MACATSRCSARSSLINGEGWQWPGAKRGLPAPHVRSGAGTLAPRLAWESGPPAGDWNLAAG